MNMRFITLLSLLVFTGFTSHAKFSGEAKAASFEPLQEKQVLVALRLIGHELMLASGDSNSRILPIQVEEGQYKVSFSNELSFHPDHLVDLVDSVLSLSGVSRSYIVEMVKCDSNRVIYSYEMRNLLDSSLIPCRGRDQPVGCYELMLSFLNEPRPSFVMASTEPEESSSFIFWLTPIVIVTVIVGVVFRRRKLANASKGFIEIGSFQFDRKNDCLLHNQNRVELTGKESELLHFLYLEKNEAVDRDVILNKVWRDEGDYVGRTLDVFISKLRKKLEADESVKIVNVRGVGYKLVVND